MYKINIKKCIGCNACESVCKNKCISTKKLYSESINSKSCIECNACVLVCPVKCIEKFN